MSVNSKVPYRMQKKRSSFWGLSFKPALTLQLSHSQQLLKVTANSHRGVTQRLSKLFSLPRKLPACSLLKQLWKFSLPGITQMLRNWRLLQGKICFLKQNLDEQYFLFMKEHIFLLCLTIFQDSDHTGNAIRRSVLLCQSEMKFFKKKPFYQELIQ